MQDMMEMQKFRCKGINLVRRRGADEVQRCRGAEVQIRSRGAEVVQRSCRSAGAEVQNARYDRDAEVQRCRGSEQVL
jgi:hypothetical protein